MTKVIDVKNVSKKYRVYYDKGNSLKEKILFKNRNQYEERSVLEDISFSVEKGEALGLIGKNGCGKSTMLKLINKIIYPDSGTISTNGRISSLIELGAGFHPDMTGRENIYTNASIFGLTHKEISARLDSIIDFSEMEQFLDNPVRTYSSGMYMRLAFSVAINVDPEILLIDEILGVGDISFQTKCFEKLRRIKAQGTTIVIVSHSLGQLEQICDRSIWFENGKIRTEGVPKFVHEQYLYSMEQDRMQKIEQEYIKKNDTVTEPAADKKVLCKVATEYKENVDDLMIENPRRKGHLLSWGGPDAIRRGNQKAYFTNAYLTDSIGERKLVFKTGEDLILHLFYKSTGEDISANVGYAIYRDDGLYCYGTNCIFEMGETILLKKSGEIQIKMPHLGLLPNRYTFDIAIQAENGTEYDNICFAVELQVSSSSRNTGICRVDNNWKFS